MLTPEEMTAQLQAFRSLFRGRDDLWGHERGRSMRHAVSPLVWWGHLYGSHPIGIYNVHDDGTCRWSAIDYDFDDPGPPQDAIKAYELFGAHPYLERSRSKGWHVWIFHENPVPLAVARKAGLGVLAVLDHPPKTEVYPKQLKPGNLGNYLRLPYPALDADNGLHRKVVVEGEALSLPEFLSVVQRTGQDPLDRLQELAPIEIFGTAAKAARQVESSMGGTPDNVLSLQQIGAVAAGTARLPKGNRDTGFFTLCKFLHGIGKSYEEAMAIVERVHTTQTDHDGDPFPLGQALTKLKRIYASEAAQ